MDPWLVEFLCAPAEFNPPFKLVKSILSYEDMNDYIERGYESRLFGRGRRKGERFRVGICI